MAIFCLYEFIFHNMLIFPIYVAKKTYFHKNIEKVDGFKKPRKVLVVDHKIGRMARLKMSKKLADPPINRKTFSVIDTISFKNEIC